MSEILIWAAAVTSGLTLYVHGVIGGRFVAAPLLADRGLPPASKWLSYYCWHVTTVLIGLMGLGFCWLALYPHIPSLVFFCVLTLALSLLSAAVARTGGIAPLRFPSTTLFAAIATLSGCAIALG